MEDDNHLDLSLGPTFTGKTAAATGKTGGVNDRDTKLINEFKHFLDGGTMQIGPGMPSQMKPENFYGNSSSTPIDLETSKDFNVGGFWITKDRQTDGNEENRPDVCEKRKNVFGETSQQKKHEKETDHSDLHEKSRASHISVNTDDGSTADNEDVADSEADASTSRLLLQADNVARGSSLSEVHKNFHGIYHPHAVELKGTKRYTVSSEKDLKTENVSQCVQFPNQPVNIMSMNQLNSAGMNIKPSYPLRGMMQVVAPTSNERTASQSALAANLPVLVGYNPVQLPKLDSENSRVPVSSHQLVGRTQLNSDKHNDGMKMTQGSSLNTYQPISLSRLQPLTNTTSIPYWTPQNSSEFRLDTKAVGHAPIEGARAEDCLKGISTTSRPNLAIDQPKTEGFPSEYPTIKPGIAADVEFGGGGSCPNLPWVSTTGTGPNGRTISGVTYRYNPSQIRIVCACHGMHLSPEEFVRHASEEQVNEDASIGVGNVPISNPDALARS